MVAIACVTRLALLDAVPFYDELYHLIAARSWLDNGTMAIADGEYTRSGLYTRLTAWIYDIAGSETAYTARMPNVLLGALLAGLAVFWTDRVAGRIAAVVVALLVVFWPSGILLSQFARFYAIHGVLFFLGATATFALFDPERGSFYRLVMAVLAMAFLWGALQFQESTMVGVLCLMVWVGLAVILPAIWRSGHRWALLAGLVLMIVALVAAAVLLGIVQHLWTEYRETPWDPDPTAYNRLLRDAYPLLWPVTPLLAIAALRQTPRPAGFCLVIVTLGLVIHSFAGVQNIRYIYYFSPFLFALWAMGVQAVLPSVLRSTRSALRDLIGPSSSGALAGAIVGFVLLFAVMANSAVPRAIKLAMGGRADPFVPRIGWAIAHDRLSELRDAGAIVVTHNDLYAIEYLGGLDVTFSENWLPEMNGIEGATDPRTGKPLISQTHSLQRLVACTPEGVFVTDPLWSPPGGYEGFFNVFQQSGVSLQIETAGRVSLLHWRTEPAAEEGPKDCPSYLAGFGFPPDSQS